MIFSEFNKSFMESVSISFEFLKIMTLAGGKEA
jgi:hypothetical protein